MEVMDLDISKTMKELEQLLEFSSEEEKQKLIDELKKLNMETPELIMKQVFEKLSETRHLLDQAKIEYEKRNNEDKGDYWNAINVGLSIGHLARAYDEISAIKENDLEDE